MQDIFQELESEVRSYCRLWPTTFLRARGAWIENCSGRTYLDFFAGAGSLNYGHNHPHLKEVLIDYIRNDGIFQSLDMHTVAKREFLESLHEVILEPRGMPHKVMFPGPAGTNAVEAALKLARKVTGRRTIGYITGAFHGMTLGSMSVSGYGAQDDAAGIPLRHALALPFDDQTLTVEESVAVLEQALAPQAVGLAAVILETVQGEGGINVARTSWLQALERMCRSAGALLIVDDVQMGCGRTGPFFSFETAELKPDIICLAKSIGGYGLPLSVLLMQPDLDHWRAGEHNGTFRGVSAAYAVGAAALRHFWRNREFESDTNRKAATLADGLTAIATNSPDRNLRVRGRGLAQAIEIEGSRRARAIVSLAFERGLLVETCGRDGQVIKLLPPLTVDEDEVKLAVSILASAVADVAG